MGLSRDAWESIGGAVTRFQPPDAPKSFLAWDNVARLSLHPAPRVSSDGETRRSEARLHFATRYSVCSSQISYLYHVDIAWVRDHITTLVANREWSVVHEGRDHRYPVIARRPIGTTDWLRSAHDAVETGINHQFALSLLDVVFPGWDDVDPSSHFPRAAMRATFRLAIYDLLLAELVPPYLPYVPMNGAAVLLILRDVFQSVPGDLIGFLRWHFRRARESVSANPVEPYWSPRER